MVFRPHRKEWSWFFNIFRDVVAARDHVPPQERALRELPYMYRPYTFFNLTCLCFIGIFLFGTLWVWRVDVRAAFGGLGAEQPDIDVPVFALRDIAPTDDAASGTLPGPAVSERIAETADAPSAAPATGAVTTSSAENQVRDAAPTDTRPESPA